MDLYSGRALLLDVETGLLALIRWDRQHVILGDRDTTKFHKREINTMV
jgi:hypothetical protein